MNDDNVLARCGIRRVDDGFVTLKKKKKKKKKKKNKEKEQEKGTGEFTVIERYHWKRTEQNRTEEEGKERRGGGKKSKNTGSSL